jgi:hypothetical protein
MKVDILAERESQFDALKASLRLTDLIEHVFAKRLLLPLLIELIRNFKTDAEYRAGVGGRNPDQYAAAYVRTRHRSRNEKEAVSRMVRDLGALYREFGGQENLLRGFVVEMLVKHALRPRYGASGRDILDDNVRFAIDNGARYESRSTIDVIGFERARGLGEVHDCKLQASHWAKERALAWARELERDVASRGLAVGLVTITARDRARGILDGLGLGRASRLVPLEELWQLVPLQP